MRISLWIKWHIIEKKKNEISIYSSSSTCWALIFYEIKFSYNKWEFIETHKEAYIDFKSKFIKGSNKYYEEINKIF